MRDQLLSEKTHAVQRTLEVWAAKHHILQIGERIVLSVYIEQTAPEVHCDTELMLRERPNDFFSRRRLMDIGVPHNLAVRAANCMEHDLSWQKKHSISTMQDFLDHYSLAKLLLVQNLGKKSIRGMVLLMRKSGLPLVDFKWNADWV